MKRDQIDPGSFDPAAGSSTSSAPSARKGPDSAVLVAIAAVSLALLLMALVLLINARSSVPMAPGEPSWTSTSTASEIRDA